MDNGRRQIELGKRKPLAGEVLYQRARLGILEHPLYLSRKIFSQLALEGQIEQILIRQNAIFNTMNVDMRALYKFLLPLGQPLVGWTGISLAGSARHLAQQSGGEALHMNRASDYGGALAKIIGNLTARYSLGFALGEDEKDDGRMHELALRVKATDPKGKQRRINVSSRRGYYMPKHESEQAAATK